MLKLDSFPAITPPPVNINQPTILVVDDSLIDRRLAGRLLEKEGEWQVSYAADGAQALEVMNRAHVLVPTIGQLGGRGIHERAEAPEQQQREISARARHARRIRPSTKDSLAVYY